MIKNICNCPNCASNNCPNADDTRLHGAAVALMGLMDAFEHDGVDVEELLPPNPSRQGTRACERTLHGRCLAV